MTKNGVHPALDYPDTFAGRLNRKFAASKVGFSRSRTCWLAWLFLLALCSSPALSPLLPTNSSASFSTSRAATPT